MTPAQIVDLYHAREHPPDAHKHFRSHGLFAGSRAVEDGILTLRCL
jgi:hypothetical protein